MKLISFDYKPLIPCSSKVTQLCCCLNIVWKSNCSGNIQKSDMLEEAGLLLQRDLLENLKENILAKINFLKLLKRKTVMGVLSKL